jgi:hypothetical protein
MDYNDEHEAYAASRCEEYVYIPTTGSTSNDRNSALLDSFSDTSNADVKLPFVVLGEQGSGKSAMLANWLSKKKMSKSKDEFLFQHFAGELMMIMSFFLSLLFLFLFFV